MNGEVGGVAEGKSTEPVINQAAIERWLVARVALAAHEEASEIDITLPFSAYALNSAAIAELTADLEDWLSLKLAPTLIWDYPSIQQLSRHLARSEEGR
jgi:acyl carrier protein